MSIEHYRKLLPVNKHSLDDELERQAEMFELISREAAKSAFNVGQAKEHLNRTEARLLLDLKDSGERLSEKVIDATIKRDPQRIDAWRSYSEALRDNDEWQHLLDSWRQRGFALKTLADLYVSSYFDARPVEVSSAPRRTRIDEHQQRYEEQRHAVRAARLERDAAPLDKSRRRLRSN